MMRVAGVVLTAVLTLVGSVRAQTGAATLRAPSGERAVLVIEQEGAVFVPADAVTEALGGTIVGDRAGYRITLGENTAGFTVDRRFGAVGEQLIEMQSAPIFVDATPFVPWQFFRDVLRFTSELDLRWDPATRVLEVGRGRFDTVDARISVIELDETTKIVIEFPRRVEHEVRREPAAYVIQTRAPVRADVADRSYEGALLDRITVRENQIVVQLSSAEVAGDPYTLESPFRIVLDLQRGSPALATTPDRPGLRLRELPGVRTIVLDPGHGGKEVGAIGPGGLVEKEATLAICRRLQSLIASSLGARVILTRDDDSLVPHDQRTAIANQYKADLFLSVHLNASRSPQARGAETYYLSLEASDDLARASAERENREADAASPPGARSPAADLDLILWDLAQQQYLRESSRFAELVQQEMNGLSGVGNRGVKQAPFRVLVGATMPAALVEVGFLSNPEEESRLGSAAYQDAVAQALLRAIRAYKAEYEARLGLERRAPERLGSGAPPPTPAAGSGR
ncbi:MAG TPA: N-acetylmuramoyl-L-alanine amidase [Thermoanaerobaculia bacterium]|nr:N-acetylmuramoyl-L-alanine amidase [Thermoanaerobaculia bacterium]